MNGKRILLMLGVLPMIVCMAASHATAYDIVEFPICTDSNRQAMPDISGNIVVWNDYRNANYDIYGYDLPNQTEFAICTDSNSQVFPAVSGNIVAWVDERAGNRDIYGYNLATQTEFLAHADSNDQHCAAVSGSVIVWRDAPLLPGSWDIYGYNLIGQNKFGICTDSNNQEIPAISGNVVVWVENLPPNSDIYGYDIVNRTKFPVCTQGNNQFDPVISGSIVVWPDYRNGNFDIFGYDLADHNEFPICTDTNDQYYASISGNIVVWDDDRNGNHDIYAYDLLNKTEFPICTDSNNQCAPAISGNIVVWEDKRDANSDIYGAYILPPAHDKCENAIPVEVNVPYYGSTLGATGMDVTACAANDVADVWHSLTPVDGNYTVSLCGSDFNTTLAVFDGCPLEANELACNDNNDLCGSGSPQSQFDVSLQAGRTYYIRVSGNNSDMGNYILKVTGPKCTTAIPGDVSGDCKVNFKDVALLALDWLDCKLEPSGLCPP